MRKAIIMAAAMTAAGLASLGIAGVPASAMTARAGTAVPAVDSNHVQVQVCDDEASPLCMNGDDGPDAPVKTYPDTPGLAQNTDITDLSNCGGKVTVSPPCPFTDSLWDSDYKGSLIISITNHANGMDYHAIDTSTGPKIIESHGGDGQVWVQYGALTGAGASAWLINVFETNEDNNPNVACSAFSGQQMWLAPAPPANYCEWSILGSSTGS